MDELDMELSAEWADLERRVHLARPDAYKTGDYDWADGLLHEATVLLADDAGQIIRDAAVAWLQRIERRSVKRANGLLRELAAGVAPLDLFELWYLPIVIGGERHRLGSCTADDFKEWELAERRRAADDFSARNAACDGAHRIHDVMVASGAERFSDLSTEDFDA